MQTAYAVAHYCMQWKVASKRGSGVADSVIGVDKILSGNRCVF